MAGKHLMHFQSGNPVCTFLRYSADWAVIRKTAPRNNSTFNVVYKVSIFNDCTMDSFVKVKVCFILIHIYYTGKPDRKVVLKYI